VEHQHSNCVGVVVMQLLMWAKTPGSCGKLFLHMINILDLPASQAATGCLNDSLAKTLTDDE
jgi:hypothetical protein